MILVRGFVAALLVAGTLAGCGDSKSDKADAGSVPTGTPAQTVSATPSSAPSATSAPTSRPTPARTSRPIPVATSDATGVPLGKDFRLQEGASARIKGTDLVVTFTRLVSDSRCPTNVTCIQAGEATIAIKVTGQGNPQTFELSAPAGQGSGDKRLGEFLIHLEAVEPYPTDPAGEARSDGPFVALLRVSWA